MAPRTPKLTVNVFERDLGLAHILKEAKKLAKKPYVKSGITQARGSKVREDGKKTTAEIAQFHEYGAPGSGVPERSFMRSTLAQNQQKYDGQLSKLGEDILDANKGMTVEKALGVIGQSYAKDVKATIRAGIEPPLKEATIRSKNASVIAKAQGRVNAITAKAESKGKLSKADLRSLQKNQEIVSTGGKSTPLIDTGQMINALSYEVVMEGSSENGKDGGEA